MASPAIAGGAGTGTRVGAGAGTGTGAATAGGAGAGAGPSTEVVGSAVTERPASASLDPAAARRPASSCPCWCSAACTVPCSCTLGVGSGPPSRKFSSNPSVIILPRGRSQRPPTLRPRVAVSVPVHTVKSELDSVRIQHAESTGPRAYTQLPHFKIASLSQPQQIHNRCAAGHVCARDACRCCGRLGRRPSHQVQL